MMSVFRLASHFTSVCYPAVLDGINGVQHHGQLPVGRTHWRQDHYIFGCFLFFIF